MAGSGKAVVAAILIAGVIAIREAWGFGFSAGGGGISAAGLANYLATNGYVKQSGSITAGNMTKFAGQMLVADGGTLDQVTFTQPSSGFSATIPNGIRYYIIGNAALLAAGTLTMPAAPVDGQRVTITSRSGITLFAINANAGQALYGGLASLAGFATWIYRASDSSWYRIA